MFNESRRTLVFDLLFVKGAESVLYGRKFLDIARVKSIATCCPGGPVVEMRAVALRALEYGQGSANF